MKEEKAVIASPCTGDGIHFIVPLEFVFEVKKTCDAGILTHALGLALGLGVEAVVVAVAAPVHEQFAGVPLAVVIPLSGGVLAVSGVLLQGACFVVRRMACDQETHQNGVTPGVIRASHITL